MVSFSQNVFLTLQPVSKCVIQPFDEDEDVLVESSHGKLLWDAVIIDVSKEAGTNKVHGYFVHFKNWSSRFDQWVVPDRIVEPNKINLEVQVIEFISPLTKSSIYNAWSLTFISYLPTG